jgi:hypothetical protein
MTISSSSFATTLKFREWPFGVIPNPEKKLIWAGRQELLKRLNRILRRLSGSPQSTLNILWADFGVGKTHALLFLRQILLEDHLNMFPIYAVLPKETHSFIDIYRAIVNSITVEQLRDIYKSIEKNATTVIPNPMIGEKWNSVLLVLRALTLGSEAYRETAIKWILADQSLSRQELIAASLPDKIRTTDDAIAVISTLIKLLSLNNQRVLLMIDEFQRTGELRRVLKNDIQSSLRTIFNNCPNYLTMLLSFKFGDATEIPTYLREELRDIADPQTIMIPIFNEDEAEEFLSDLINKVVLNEQMISNDVVHTLIKLISTIGDLKPRLITKTANLIFSDCAMDLQDKEIDILTTQYIDEKFKYHLPVIKTIADEKED